MVKRQPSMYSTGSGSSTITLSPTQYTTQRLCLVVDILSSHRFLTTAAVASRQQVLSKISLCPEPMEEEPLGYDGSPLGLAIGTSTYRYHIGAMYGNMLLFAILAIVFAMVSAIVGMTVKEQGFSEKHLSPSPTFAASAWHRGSTTLRFPGRLIPLSLFLFQPTVTSTLTVLLYANDAENYMHQIAAAAVSLFLLCTMVIVPLAPSGFKKSFLRSVSLVLFPPGGVTKDVVQFLTDAPGGWASLGRSSTTVLTNEIPFAVERLGSGFEDYKPEAISTAYFDILVGSLGSCLVAIIPTNKEACVYMNAAAVAIFLLATVYALAMRPFLSRLNNLFYSIISLAQLGSVIAVVAAEDTNNSLWLERYDTAEMVMSFTVLIWTLFQLGEGLYYMCERRGLPKGYWYLEDEMMTRAVQEMKAASEEKLGGLYDMDPGAFLNTTSRPEAANSSKRSKKAVGIRNAILATRLYPRYPLKPDDDAIDAHRDVVEFVDRYAAVVAQAASDEED